jgi:hypothetical protein
MFVIDARKFRREFPFRMRFGVGGRRSWRVRLQRPALFVFFKIGAAPLRIFRTGASAFEIFIRARSRGLCGFESLDLELFGVHIPHNWGFQ